MIDSNMQIASNKKIADKTYEMVLESSELFQSQGIEIKPGQFVNIKIEGFFLRRPISICDWSENTITIIYKVVGKGTEKMSQMLAGDSLDVLLTLGNGYDVTDVTERPVCIGGGAGVPPMYGLCKSLIAAGKKPVAVIGFNTESEVFYEQEFKALGAETVVVAADGSVGAKGFVTDVLGELGGTEYFACGPEPMLKAIDKTVPAEAVGHFSFEERMGCGFGACMGCSCKTKYGNKRICKEGPVLERSEIIW